MRDTKDISFSELVIGQKLVGYNSPSQSCIFHCSVKHIKGNTVTLVSGGSTEILQNADQYKFKVELNRSEFVEKYEADVEEIKAALQRKLGQLDGDHEMWNTWLYAGDVYDIAAELKKNDMRIIGYATLSVPKRSITDTYDIGVIAEYDNGERIWCHCSEKWRKFLVTGEAEEL